MAIAVAGLLFQLLAVSCFALVLLHAFARSVGTGVMVLLLPVYNVVYGFTQFEHRRKGWVLAGWLGGFVAGVVLRSLSFVNR
jgi:translocator protein